MKLYRLVGQSAGRKGGCCTPRDMDDARKVCEQLGHSVYAVQATSPSSKRACIEPFVADYLAGRTPNPCVRCNQDVKFDILLREARALGCELLATGHYAQASCSRDGAADATSGAA